MEIGKYNRARVESIMPQGYYLELETGGRVLLPGNREEFSLEEGEIRPFAGKDGIDRKSGWRRTAGGGGITGEKKLVTNQVIVYNGIRRGNNHIRPVG